MIRPHEIGSHPDQVRSHMIKSHKTSPYQNTSHQNRLTPFPGEHLTSIEKDTWKIYLHNHQLFLSGQKQAKRK